VKGKGFYTLAKKYNTSASTIRGWYEKNDKIFQSLLDPDISAKVARRVKGGGRKHDHKKSRFSCQGQVVPDQSQRTL
jgi:hypothetical protein